MTDLLGVLAGEEFPHLTHLPELSALHIDKREVTLTAATIEVLREVSDELRRQGFRLYPAALDGIARAFDAAATQCTCGGQNVCTVCVLAQLEGESA